MKTDCISPVLQVSDLDESIQFYKDILGFDHDFTYGAPPYYAGLRMGCISIHLNMADKTSSRVGKGSVFISCDEVDTYYEKLTDKGVEITSELATWPYDVRDFQIKDIDGNLLCFGCPATS